MKVYVIVLNHYAPDIRVEKEVTTLMQNGYDITIIARAKKKFAEIEDKDGIKIIRIGPENNPGEESRITNIKYLFNTINTIRKLDCDVLHAHDLDAFLVASLSVLFSFKKKKIIYDAHEVPSAAYCKDGTLISKIIYQLELILIKLLAYKVVVVIDENRIRLINNKIPEKKIVVCSNTAKINVLENIESSYTRKSNETTLISYVGGFTKHRGLDVLIESVPKILKNTESFEIVLVGDGEEKNNLEKLSENTTKGHVKFTGWLNFPEAMEYILRSDICVLPYHSTIETNNTIPHKLFQYMFFRKPVVVSDVGPLKRIVEEVDSGIVFKAGNADDLAKNIITIIENEQLRNKYGENGHKAVIEKYNWNVDGKNLINLYDELKETVHEKK